jgi:CheY-like chemotaxis protein
MLENGLRSTRCGDKVLTLRGKRILVVEDDPVVAVDYHFLLEGVGALQAFAPSNPRALAYLGTHAVDGAIIDYHLTDGICTPVLKLLVALHVPFVVISGDTFGVDDVPPNAPMLSKPVTAADVCLALSGVVH